MWKRKKQTSSYLNPIPLVLQLEISKFVSAVGRYHLRRQAHDIEMMRDDEERDEEKRQGSGAEHTCW